MRILVQPMWVNPFELISLSERYLSRSAAIHTYCTVYSVSQKKRNIARQNYIQNVAVLLTRAVRRQVKVGIAG